MGYLQGSQEAPDFPLKYGSMELDLPFNEAMKESNNNIMAQRREKKNY